MRTMKFYNERGKFSKVVAFDGINVLDIMLGANAAYADGESGKIYMNLITGKVFNGEASTGKEIDSDTSYDTDDSSSSSGGGNGNQQSGGNGNQQSGGNGNQQSGGNGNQQSGGNGNQQQDGE